MTHPIAIIGVSGYAGMELAGLVDRHPELRLCAATSDRWRGRRLGELLGLSGATSDVEVTSMEAATALPDETQIACLATPADVSARLVPALLDRGIRVVDLSGAFRLRNPREYPRWYGFEHPSPGVLEEARYGLIGLDASWGTSRPADALRLVANPGCYATAAILALAPLVAAKLVDPGAIFVDGKSGVTGAGRKVEERLTFCEVDENLSPYRVASHQHAPEIEQALGRVAGGSVRVTFTPHLLPIRRGLLVTAYGRLLGDASREAVQTAMRAHYAESSTVDVVAPPEVTIASVARTERARVAVEVDEERGTWVALCAIDNLLQGAASQALQNVCAMLRLPDPYRRAPARRPPTPEAREVSA